MRILMNGKFSYFLFSITIIVSCSNNSNSKIEISQKEKSEIRIFDFDCIAQDSLSKYAKNVDFINLETKSECLLTDQLISIKFSINYIFIAEIGGVFQFDKAGKFIRQIGRLGKGPQEYPQVNALQIDNKQEAIYIFPGKTTGKILQYNFKGEFIKEIKITNRDFVGFDYDDGSFIFYPFCFEKFQGNYNMLYVIDRFSGEDKTTIESNIFPSIINKYPKVISYGATRDWSWKYNGKLYFLENGSDTILQIDNDTPIFRYALKGDNKISLNELFFSREIKSNSIQLIDKGIMPANSCIYESNHFIFFRCVSNGIKFFNAYEKETGNTYQSNYLNKYSEEKEEDSLVSIKKC